MLLINILLIYSISSVLVFLFFPGMFSLPFFFFSFASTKHEIIVCQKIICLLLFLFVTNSIFFSLLDFWGDITGFEISQAHCWACKLQSGIHQWDPLGLFFCFVSFPEKGKCSFPDRQRPLPPISPSPPPAPVGLLWMENIIYIFIVTNKE